MKILETVVALAMAYGVAQAATEDSFAGARELSGESGSAAFANAGYGLEEGEPVHSSDGYSGGASAWARWTAPETGDWVFRLSGTGAGGRELDTQLAVYAGASLGALERVAANDDVPGSYSSRVSFGAVAGREYRIAMDTYRGAEGTMTLEWSPGWMEPAEFAQYGQYMPAEGGRLAVGVASASGWRVTGASGWIAVEKGGGEDGEAMVCTVAANGTGASREGFVAVAASAGEKEEGTLKVFQTSVSFVTNRAAALEKASAEGKRVLLLHGREGCGNCFATMMDNLPSAGVRERLEAGYVLWYDNCDRQGEDAWRYLSGLGSYYLPVLCTIAADDAETHLERTTGYRAPSELSALLGHVVVFDAHGGSAAEKVRFLKDGDMLGELPAASRPGFGWLGWFTAESGGELATARTRTGSGGVTVLHARWTATAAPEIEAAEWIGNGPGNGGTFRCTVGAVAGNTYELQKCAGLDSGDGVWRAVTAVSASADGPLALDAAIAPGERAGYFRVEETD